MIKAFFGDPKWRWHAYGGGALIIGSLIFQTWLTVLFSYWQRDFFDIIGKPADHTKAQFWSAIWMFVYLVFPYLIAVVMTKLLGRFYTLWWREAITFDYVPRWRNVTQEIEGASQRIQEDTKRFAEAAEQFGDFRGTFGFFQSKPSEHVTCLPLRSI